MIHEVAFDNAIICTIVSNKTSFCSERRPWQNKLDNLEAIIKLDRLCLWLVTLQTFYCNGVSFVHCFRKRSIRVFLKRNEKEANSMLKTKIKICIQQNVKHQVIKFMCSDFHTKNAQLSKIFNESNLLSLTLLKWRSLMPDSGKQDTEIRENITMKTTKHPFLAAILNRTKL